MPLKDGIGKPIGDYHSRGKRGRDFEWEGASMERRILLFAPLGCVLNILWGRVVAPSIYIEYLEPRSAQRKSRILEVFNGRSQRGTHRFAGSRNNVIGSLAFPRWKRNDSWRVPRCHRGAFPFRGQRGKTSGEGATATVLGRRVN